MYDSDKIILKPVDDVDIKINVDLIPEYQRRQLADAVLIMTQKLFSQPGEEERYQLWLQERQKREKK